MTRVLVAYATRHGATRGIAERIAEVLRGEGIDADLRPVGELSSPTDVSGYDAFVVGSAAYFGQWLKEATGFVRANAATLSTRPTWLFSSGPIGSERIDKHGKDVVAASIPVEFRSLAAEVHPRDEHVFYGALDVNERPQGMAEGLMSRMVNLFPTIREAMPSGDFRDWAEIEGWARGIAQALGGREPAPTGTAA